MDVDKKELRKKFSEDWKKHYLLEALVSRGYKRQKCGKCGRMFWSIEPRQLCADAGCIGFQFIGDTPVKKKLGYIDTWKLIEKYFTSNGHGYVKPYPTVARWRDDLYFTIASINDFQPYVVNGELEPPHNPLIVPQPCIRFPDLANVGVTGSHYTNFVMIGQHSFNTKKTGLFYWKNEAIEHDLSYLKALGIPEKEIVFQEDVWAGGGNFGPSMEYFVRGLELGNCVFMQYEVTPSGNRELKTKVIDMGAGLSRLSWITSGDLMSYDAVFGDVIKRMKKKAGIEIDPKLMLKFSKIAGSLNIDEVEDIEIEKERVAKSLGMAKEELFGTLEPLQALYASADHLCTLLFTVTDGMLPSNSGGGYNLRMILRRVFGFSERHGLEMDYAEIINGHAEHLNYIFPHLKEGVGTTIDIVEEEKKKYAATKEKARTIVAGLVSRAKKDMGAVSKKERESAGAVGSDELIVMYKSNGIPPEYIIEVARENGVSVKMPGNFYELVRAGEGETRKEEEKKKVLVSELPEFPKTKLLYYEETGKFGAKVLGVVKDRYVVLDSSAFYPEGGGQVADSGTINGVPVVHVSKAAGVVLHEVKDASKFRKGADVKCDVDMERRKTITRHHTCVHLLNAACREILGQHIWQAGAYKDEHKGQLDVTHYRRITNEEIERIEKKVNEYVMRNMPIKIEVLPRNKAEGKYGFRLYQGGVVPGKELRIVSMGDIDHEACGGTHHMIRSTGEIGAFKIVKRESVQDGVERLTLKAGNVAMEYMQERDRMIRDAAGALSVSDSELVRSVERFFTEWKQQRKKMEELGELVMSSEAKSIAMECMAGKPVVKIVDVDIQLLRKLAQELGKEEKCAACIINKQGDAVCVCGAKSQYKAKDMMARAIAELGGNGGGSDRIASGKVKKASLFRL
ncbi:alanine--tRNA ligase [Candidatus Micrarchaeota archaeon]|nr:alanine--tRNA ligase [Candidatus Micrarchaeota archaeon]